METVHTLVDAETMRAYSSPDAILAITRAFYELSALYDDLNLLPYGGTIGNTNLTCSHNNHNMAVTKLAVAILINARQHIKSRNTDVTPISIDKMVTEEIRQLLLIGDPVDEATIENNFYNSNPSTNAFGESN